MQIVYCEKCGKRISEGDLQNKLAFQVEENRYNCAQCAPAGTPGTQPVQRVGHSTKSRIAPARPSTRAPSSRMKAAKPASNAMLPVLIGAGVLVVIVVLFVVLRGGSEPPAPKKTASVPPPPPAVVSPPVRQPPVITAPVQPDKTPEEPAIAKTAEPANPEPPQPSMAEIRNEIAAKALASAQAFSKEHPDDPWTYQEKLQEITRTYATTPAGSEADKLLADLKVPPRPQRVGSGDWEVLFANGKDPYKMASLDGWKVVNGMLERVPSIDNSAQMKKVISDGEFRIRFEWSCDAQANFTFRQGREGGYRIILDRSFATKLKGKVNEMVVLLDGKRCTASINGETVSVHNQGEPASGMIQFNTKGEMLRIHSIEQRGLVVKE